MIQGEFLDYANDVVNGKILACRQVIKACKRFLNDLHRDEFYFSMDAYGHVKTFIENMAHTQGEWQGKPVVLEPWQCFILANIFGFYRKSTKSRRFRVSYVEVPRKNAKSTLASWINNYGLLADDEPGAQVYSAATKLMQSKMVFDESYRCLKKLDWVLEAGVKCHSSQNMNVIKFGDSIYKPLEWAPESMDGLNTHFCAIDEYHAHKSDALFNVMKNSMGARLQPLLHVITTAGFNKESPCYNYRKYCEKILNGELEDDSLFAIMYTLDKDDDWQNPKMWQKANPNYGVSVYPQFLLDGLKEAKERVSKEIEFKTKLLNIWTDTEMTWIADDKWKACASNEEPFGDCYGGLDLATTSDFCAYSLFWPANKFMRTWYFVPEDSVRERNDQAGDSIREWVHQDFICATPGNVTDYDYIREKINELSEIYGMPKDIAFDPYNSSQLVIQLQDEGYKLFKFRQGFLSMSQPTKEFERMVLKGELKHDGNPVCRWMMGNVLLKTDPAMNVKIDKSKSGDKVDGPVSKVMAVGTWMDDNLNHEAVPEFFVQAL